MKQLHTILVIIGIFVSCGNSDKKESDTESDSEQSATYEKFKVDYSLKGNSLEVSLETDLPDDIKVSVRVSRSYWEIGNSSEYSVDYISEQSTIGKWRQKREIIIDDEKWKSDLAKKQEELSAAGLGFDVDRVSDSIKIYAVVPLSNKPYPDFKGGGTVKTEIIISSPIGGSIDKESKYGHYQSLEEGKTYEVSRTVPLMTEFNPSDPIATINEMIELPPQSRIIIVSKKSKKDTPWYEVKAMDEHNNPIGSGWVNGIALSGQELKVIQ